MASSIKGWLLLQIPRLLTKFGTKTLVAGSKTKYRLCVGLTQTYPYRKSLRELFPLTGTSLMSMLRRGQQLGQASDDRCRRRFSGLGNDGEDKDPQSSGRPLKLMDFDELIWPHPFKSIRNAFFTLLIRGYFDEHFSSSHFLNGAEQVRQDHSFIEGRGLVGGNTDLFDLNIIYFSNCWLAFQVLW